MSADTSSWPKIALVKIRKEIAYNVEVDFMCIMVLMDYMFVGLAQIKIYLVLVFNVAQWDVVSAKMEIIS